MIITGTVRRSGAQAASHESERGKKVGRKIKEGKNHVGPGAAYHWFYSCSVTGISKLPHAYWRYHKHPMSRGISASLPSLRFCSIFIRHIFLSLPMTGSSASMNWKRPVRQRSWVQRTQKWIPLNGPHGLHDNWHPMNAVIEGRAYLQQPTWRTGNRCESLSYKNHITIQARSIGGWHTI